MKCGWIIALHRNLFRYGDKYLFFLYRKRSLLLILLITFKVIASPDRFLSRSKPKYVTFQYCLILMLPNFISNVPEKRIDLVLSLRKWILSLLPTNQSNMLQKFLVSSLFIWFRFLCWYSKHVSSAYRNRSLSTACGINSKNNKGPRKDPYETPHLNLTL